jgi:PAS domain S-box-containing protein
MITTWIFPPATDNDRIDYVARIIHASLVSIAVLGAITWVLEAYLVPDSSTRFFVIFLCVLIVSGILLSVNRRRPVLAGVLALAFIWLIVTGSVATSGGVHAPARFGYFLLITIAALAFGYRVSFALLLATVAATMAMVWIEYEGLLPAPSVVHTPLSMAVLQCYGFVATFAIVAVASNATWGYIDKRRVAETRLGEANAALDELVEKLNARVEQLEFVHRSAGLVSWVWDVVADRVEWVGDREALMGVPAGHGSRTFRDYRSRLHPDDRESAWRRLHDCLKGTHPRYRAHERIVLPDGSIRWLEVMGQSESGAERRTVRMAGVMRDVTEQHQAHEKVAASERRFRGLFDSALDGIAILSADGALIDANPTCCRETGYARDDLIGRPFSRFFPAEDVPDQWEVFGKIQKRGSVISESRIQRKDGRLIPVEIHAWRLPDGNVQAVLRDIGERKRAEERFAKIFRVGPGSITISRMADGKYIDVNDEWYRWSGYTREETIGQTAMDIQVWAEPSERARLIEAIHRNGSVRNFETRLRRKSGEVADIVLAAELLDLEGELHVMIAIDDVTSRKRAAAEIVRLNASLEQRVRDRTAELQEANRDLESFSFSISHDLQAPLRSILGFTQIIAKSHAAALADEGRRLFARVEHNAKRMSALIEDLLAFSRIGKGRLTRTRLVDMHSQVAGLLEELDLQGKVELADLPSVDGDPSMLRQVWQNLILNALKFSRNAAAPKVRITGSRREDGQLEYSVEDNGVGFDMIHADKLFGVFQRLHSERDFEGTGVGLAVVHRIIVRHGGQIFAHSAPGQGARFTFVLPESAQPAD